jgi:hypothetical protein
MTVRYRRTTDKDCDLCRWRAQSAAGMDRMAEFSFGRIFYAFLRRFSGLERVVDNSGVRLVLLSVADVTAPPETKDMSLDYSLLTPT